MLNEVMILAAEITSTTVTNTPIFSPIKAIFRVLGIGYLFIATFKAVKEVASGKTMDAVKQFAFGLIAAILCWDISAPLSVLDGSGSLVTKITSSISQILGSVNG
jgi:hypothetical protein